MVAGRCGGWDACSLSVAFLCFTSWTILCPVGFLLVTCTIMKAKKQKQKYLTRSHCVNPNFVNIHDSTT